MKDVIILEKVRKKEKLSESRVDITILLEVAQILSPIDLARRYKYVMSNADIDTAKELGLIEVKKY